MCGLFAARTKADLIMLSKSNLHRGSRTHSVSTFNNGHMSVHRFTGAFNPSNIPDSADFYICHVQAPTSQKSEAHPAKTLFIDEAHTILMDSYVWHNGILKEKYMAEQQYDWDTECIAFKVPNGEINELDGSFACFHYMGDTLTVFRNELSPLFYGEIGQFSSTKTQLTPTPVEANKVFKIDIESAKLTQVSEFKTLENPYFFM